MNTKNQLCKGKSPFIVDVWYWYLMLLSLSLKYYIIYGFKAAPILLLGRSFFPPTYIFLFRVTVKLSQHVLRRRQRNILESQLSNSIIKYDIKICCLKHAMWNGPSWEKHKLLKHDVETDLSPSSRTEDNFTIQRDLETPDRGINWQTGLLKTLFSMSRLLNWISPTNDLSPKRWWRGD